MMIGSEAREAFTRSEKPNVTRSIKYPSRCWRKRKEFFKMSDTFAEMQSQVVSYTTSFYMIEKLDKRTFPKVFQTMETLKRRSLQSPVSDTRTANEKCTSSHRALCTTPSVKARRSHANTTAQEILRASSLKVMCSDSLKTALRYLESEAILDDQRVAMVRAKIAKTWFVPGGKFLAVADPLTRFARNKSVVRRFHSDSKYLDSPSRFLSATSEGDPVPQEARDRSF